jgi:hypothetical protein
VGKLVQKEEVAVGLENAPLSTRLNASVPSCVFC